MPKHVINVINQETSCDVKNLDVLISSEFRNQQATKVFMLCFCDTSTKGKLNFVE